MTRKAIAQELVKVARSLAAVEPSMEDYDDAYRRAKSTLTKLTRQLPAHRQRALSLDEADESVELEVVRIQRAAEYLESTYKDLSR